MPIYEYVCQDCSNKFELLVRSSTKTQCPSCHGTKLEKQLSVFAAATSSSGADMSAIAPCGSCGDPRGPGSCAIN